MHSRLQLVQSGLSSLVNKQVQQFMIGCVFFTVWPGSAVNTEEEEVDWATHLINYTRACRAAPGKARRSADI